MKPIRSTSLFFIDGIGDHGVSRCSSTRRQEMKQNSVPKRYAVAEVFLIDAQRLDFIPKTGNAKAADRDPIGIYCVARR